MRTNDNEKIMVKYNNLKITLDDEDLVQDCILKYLEKAHHIRDNNTRNVRYQSIKKDLIEKANKEKPVEIISDEQCSYTIELSSSEEVFDAFRIASSVLNYMERVVLYYRLIEGMTYNDISHKINRSCTRVMSIYSHAISRIKYPMKLMLGGNVDYNTFTTTNEYNYSFLLDKNYDIHLYHKWRNKYKNSHKKNIEKINIDLKTRDQCKKNKMKIEIIRNRIISNIKYYTESYTAICNMYAPLINDIISSIKNINKLLQFEERLNIGWTITYNDLYNNIYDLYMNHYNTGNYIPVNKDYIKSTYLYKLIGSDVILFTRENESIVDYIARDDVKYDEFFEVIRHRIMYLNTAKSIFIHKDDINKYVDEEITKLKIR